MKRNVCLSVVVAMVAVTTVATACGGDDGKSSAVGKCNDFLEAVCNQYISCGVYEKDEREDCLEDGADEVDCDKAVSVGKSFKECISDLNSDECFDELPSSCEEVIKVP